MKFHKYFFLFLLVISSSHCVKNENRCPLKSTCNESWYSSNITCVKQHNCSINETVSSTVSTAYAMSLDNVLITYDQEGLWVQLRLKNQEELLHKGASYMAYVAFNDAFCYQFTMLNISEKNFNFPCIKAPVVITKDLKLLIWIYKISLNKSQLVFLQANRYALNALTKKKSINVNHILKNLSMEGQYLKLAVWTPCSFSYKVAVHQLRENICSTRGTPLCKVNSLLENKFIWQQISVYCPQILFKPNRIYCMQTVFSSLRHCSSTHAKMTTEIAYFKNTVSEKCRHWNATVTITNSSTDVKVHFSPFKEHLNCFFCFQVLLFKISNHNCSSNFRVLINSKKVTLHKEQGHVTFNNLSRGNYCPMIEPCVNSVLRINTIAVSILEAPTRAATSELRNHLDVLLASVILLSVVGLAIVLQIKQHCSGKKKMVKIPVEERPVAPSPKKVTVNLVEGSPKSSGLSGLLRFCFPDVHCEVLLDKFLIDHVHWPIEIMDYQCRAMGDEEDSDEKFVFVQSDPPDPATNIGKMFHSVLNTFITIHPERCRRDYCHLFVVQLEASRGGSIEQLVPNKRYNKDNLVNLCLDLGYPKNQKTALIQAVDEWIIKHHL